ncbi:MAG: hypothetical protein J6S72_08770 [Lachnospiraceae bacterium]|nr:hypothetical protein [Lachnospiraceae bacterium]MBO7634452.1 hypothetical protein [Lachnospiraceae bacterium]
MTENDKTAVKMINDMLCMSSEDYKAFKKKVLADPELNETSRTLWAAIFAEVDKSRRK